MAILSKSIGIALFALLLGCGPLDNDSDTYDLNGDGVADVFYEFESDGYFELVDRNFDGRIDESAQYGLNDLLIRGKSDDDFNGILETQIISENSLVKYLLVDSNRDNLIDIILEYKHGVVSTGERYYPSIDGKLPPQLGNVKFDFGYPSSETIISTELSATQFHERAPRHIPTRLPGVLAK